MESEDVFRSLEGSWTLYREISVKGKKPYRAMGPALFSPVNGNTTHLKEECKQRHMAALLESEFVLDGDRITWRFPNHTFAFSSEKPTALSELERERCQATFTWQRPTAFSLELSLDSPEEQLVIKTEYRRDL